MTLQIPNYEIKSVLGEGGMAVVYLAEHRLLHNRVALKVLNREFVHNGNIKKRFLSEARSMAKMSHPNIVRVTDLLEEGETVAFIMEYIEGESLKDYLVRKGKLDNDEIRYILLQMLEALEYVHSQGLVHRDIKPSNFMLTPQGKVKLMDFGIAKQTNTSSPEYTSTGTNQQMGTPMYMSPEQIQETRNVTEQSDIYSLGVVLWQMVTGRKPYDLGTLSTYQLQTKIVTEPLSKTNTGWDGVIQQATVKDLDGRLKLAKEFRSKIISVEQNKDIKNASNQNNLSVEELAKSGVNYAPKAQISTYTRKSKLFAVMSGLFLVLILGYYSLYHIPSINNNPKIDEVFSEEMELVHDSISIYKSKKVNEIYKDTPAMDKVTLPIASAPIEDNEIYMIVEDMPLFPGCDTEKTKEEKKKCSDRKVQEFILSNLKYPINAIENGIEGTVVVSFIIGINGSLNEVSVIKEIGGGCGEEASRIVNIMNESGIRWSPGRQNGKEVKVQFRLPIRFKLP